MALFDGVRAAFDRGGIGLKLELPKRFAWGDSTIPATVTLTGHKTEARLIRRLDFEFLNVVEVKDRSSSQDESGNIVRVLYEHPTEISLGPRETIVVTVDTPAFEDLDVINEAVKESGAPQFMQKMTKFALKSGARPEDISEFQLSVAAHVDGIKHPKRAARRILNSRSMGWKSRTTIAGFDIT